MKFNSYYREATVGLIVLVGVGLFIFGTVWLRGRAWGNPPVLRVAFENIMTLKEGSPVRVSGAVVGTVEEIRLEAPGRVMVSITYDRKLITPATDASAALIGVGMLGDMAIDLDPGTGSPLPEGTVITGTAVKGLFDAGTDLMGQASTTMTSLNAMLDPALVSDLRRTLASSERLMQYLANERTGPMAEVNETMRSLQGLSRRFDSTLAAVDARALTARLDSTMQSTATLTDQLTATSAQVDSLLAGIRRGEGTLGRLAADSGLYLDLRRTLQATSNLVDSLAKNPGKLGITVKMF
ncbi:MAG: MlaD family protein [Gemmatimonadales bacterium]|nr:MlaD family protein [Gemmatimonadales bacterium]MDZ4389981.1 MlaD family protein [Gemmatimonadales bacterium]